jgi:hypothetical protein
MIECFRIGKRIIIKTAPLRKMLGITDESRERARTSDEAA